MLNEEGVYRLYDLQGDYQQYSLGNEAAEMGIVDARIHQYGLVALTGSLTLLETKGWEGAKPLTLSNPGNSLNLLTVAFTHTVRSYEPSSLLGHHPARLDYLQTRRGTTIRRCDCIQRGQFGKYRSTALKRTVLTSVTVSEWKVAGPAHGQRHFMGCLDRLPAKLSGIRYKRCPRSSWRDTTSGMVWQRCCIGDLGVHCCTCWPVWRYSTVNFSLYLDALFC